VESLGTPKLTDKQKMFCREYLIDLNATQACIRAGYSKKTARSVGCENLTKPYIQAEIQRLKTKRHKKIDLSVEKVLKDLEYVRKKTLGEGQYGVSLKATELQGKHLAMFTDKTQVEGEVSMPVINIQLKDEE